VLAFAALPLVAVVLEHLCQQAACCRCCQQVLLLLLLEQQMCR
jgi:hypothetical protein